MIETKSVEQNRFESFLASPQFVRFCEVFETYQRLLQESKNDSEQQRTMKERMLVVFGRREYSASETAGSQEPANQDRSEMDKMREQIFTWAEKGELTKEKMADLFAHFSLADKMLQQYNQKSGEYITNEGENFLLNKVVSYREDGDNVSVDIIPTAVKGTAEMVQKIVEGFSKLAQEMKEGKFKHIKNVGMFSWLLGPAFADKIKMLLGDDINLQEPDEEERTSVENVQRLALTYNKRAVEEYLKTGQMPPVRKLWMAREEFLKKFGNE